MAAQFDDTDEGLSIVLSPVQLAAVMQGRSIFLTEAIGNRFATRAFGALAMIGGAIELIGSAALLLTPEPTLLAKAGGVVLGANGADNAVTGAAELWSGLPRTTLTQQAAAAAARNLGLSPDAADTVGVVVDIAVPFFVAGGLGAARALSIREGMIDLFAEEKAGGHTIDKHVGKSEAFLRNRLATERIKGAGTFRTLADAEKYVSRAIQANAAQIQTWASSTNSQRLLLAYSAGETVGVVIPRSTGILQNASKINVVLIRKVVGRKIYFVFTAYPEF